MGPEPDSRGPEAANPPPTSDQAALLTTGSIHHGTLPHLALSPPFMLLQALGSMFLAARTKH